MPSSSPREDGIKKRRNYYWRNGLYDPDETEKVREFLLELFTRCPGLVLVGGWAVHYAVTGEHQKRTGDEYLHSRDIDVHVPDSEIDRLRTVMHQLGFVPGGLSFRFSLQLDRETGELLSEARARDLPVFGMITIDLDLFSGGGFDESWVLPQDLAESLTSATPVSIGGVQIRIATAEDLARMKGLAVLNRPDEGKEIKDACDLYALMKYIPDSRAALSEDIHDRLVQHSRQIASQLYGDEELEGIVVRDLRSWKT